MKFNQFLCASILLGSVAAADASGPLAVSPVKVNDPSSTDLTSRLLTVPRQEIRGLSLSESTQPEKLTIKRETVLVEEDFNNCPDGHTETIGHLGERYTDYLASGYFPTVDGYVINYINNDFTPGSGTWAGDFVMAGKGGTIILQCYNPELPAYISTPLGDYSGNITVTVRCRFARTFWGAENELGYVTTAGSELELAAFIGGFGSLETSVSELGSTGYGKSSGSFYENEGWQDVTFTFLNESANSDGTLQLLTSTAVEIDYVKITDDNSYLAKPVLKEPTDFTDDGFTIHWDKVRRAYDYIIDLYKVNYTAETGLDLNYDFNDGKLPEGFTCSHIDFADEMGSDGSTAAVLDMDNAESPLQTPEYDSRIGSFQAKVCFEIPDYDHETGEGFVYCGVVFYGLSDDGWEPIGKMDDLDCASNQWYNARIEGEAFENRYKAIGIYTSGMTDECRLYVDDIKIWGPRPYELQRVYRDGSVKPVDEFDDDPYNYYTFTGIRTSSDPQDPGRQANWYTFINLDPETEYWYRVRSHNDGEYGVGERCHAFGVPAPHLEKASAITHDSYVANWSDAPKAQSYLVTNYMVNEILAADSQYPLLSEGFSECHGESDFYMMSSLNNEMETLLDDYTDMKGWLGRNNAVGEGMLGATASNGYLITPPLMLNPSRATAYMWIEAYGTPGDYLNVQYLADPSNNGYAKFDNDGRIAGSLPLALIEGQQVRFNSMYGMGFAISKFEMIQAVEAGDKVRSFISEVIVPAGVQSCSFDNLAKDGEFGYSVVSVFNLEKETVRSLSNDWVFVNLANGETGTTVVDELSEAPFEVARYTVDGKMVSTDYKGLVIIRMSDGSVGKKLVK